MKTFEKFNICAISTAWTRTYTKNFIHYFKNGLHRYLPNEDNRFQLIFAH